MDYHTLTDTMRSLALDAGARIMEIYGSGDMDTRQKDDDSPVTAADEAADALISAGLRAAFPDTPLITEEQAATHGTDARTFLIVDPLDGTKEFIRRRGEFTVNIAYVENAAPMRGVVYAPARGRLFYTDAAGTAFEDRIEDGRVTETLRLSVATPNNDALHVVASKSHRDQATDDYIAQYSVSETKSAGSSLKFCLIASGEADLYPRLGRTMEWDTAAGHAVLHAAGGHVVRLDDLTPLIYGKPGHANPYFAAYAPGVNVKRS